MQVLTFKNLNLSSIPNLTGVYLFKKGDKPLYIGKAISLRARIRSHLENAKLDPKEALIIKNCDKIGYQITDSEFKALLLESSLIQKYHPKYNPHFLKQHNILAQRGPCSI